MPPSAISSVDSSDNFDRPRLMVDIATLATPGASAKTTARLAVSLSRKVLSVIHRESPHLETRINKRIGEGGRGRGKRPTRTCNNGLRALARSFSSSITRHENNCYYRWVYRCHLVYDERGERGRGNVSDGLIYENIANNYSGR